MEILSYDCANRALGVVGVTWNSDWITQAIAHIDKMLLDRRIDSADIIKLRDIISNQWEITYIDNIDVLDCKVKDTTVEQRCKALKATIKAVDARFNTPDIVLVEDQMNVNEKSRGVYYCLMYNYCDKVKSIKSHRKNKVKFSKARQDYLVKYAKAYDANKAFAVDNFTTYVNENNQLYAADMLKSIKPAKIKDIADAFCQIVAFTLNI